MFYNIRNITNFKKNFIALLKNMKYICIRNGSSITT